MTNTTAPNQILSMVSLIDSDEYDIEENVNIENEITLADILRNGEIVMEGTPPTPMEAIDNQQNLTAMDVTEEGMWVEAPTPTDIFTEDPFSPDFPDVDGYVDAQFDINTTQPESITNITPEPTGEPDAGSILGPLIKKTQLQEIDIAALKAVTQLAVCMRIQDLIRMEIGPDTLIGYITNRLRDLSQLANSHPIINQLRITIIDFMLSCHDEEIKPYLTDDDILFFLKHHNDVSYSINLALNEPSVSLIQTRTGIYTYLLLSLFNDFFGTSGPPATLHILSRVKETPHNRMLLNELQCYFSFLFIFQLKQMEQSHSFQATENIKMNKQYLTQFSFLSSPPNQTQTEAVNEYKSPGPKLN